VCTMAFTAETRLICALKATFRLSGDLDWAPPNSSFFIEIF
jgi:hypothetical protein